MLESNTRAGRRGGWERLLLPFQQLDQISHLKSCYCSWVPAVEQAINTMYVLAEHPDSLVQQLLGSLGGSLGSMGTASASSRLQRLLFTVGHVAVSHPIALEAGCALCCHRERHAGLRLTTGWL